MNKDEMKKIFSEGIDGLNEKTCKEFCIVTLKREMNKILKALNNGLKDIHPLVEAFDKDPCCDTFSDVYNAARAFGIALFGESTVAQTRAEYMLHGLEEVADDLSEDKEAEATSRKFRRIEVDEDDKVVIGPEMNKEEFGQYLVNLILKKNEEKKED